MIFALHEYQNMLKVWITRQPLVYVATNMLTQLKLRWNCFMAKCIRVSVAPVSTGCKESGSMPHKLKMIRNWAKLLALHNIISAIFVLGIAAAQLTQAFKHVASYATWKVCNFLSHPIFILSTNGALIKRCPSMVASSWTRELFGKNWVAVLESASSDSVDKL